MKKTICAVLALCLAILSAAPALAESVTPDPVQVTFTADGVMDSGHAADVLRDGLALLQPGDDITLRVVLRNENEANVDWYMTNEVIRSLEDRSLGAGGAYTFLLTYRSAAGETLVLCSGDSVGGGITDEGGEGLHEAARGLEDYVYLDTMQPGGSGMISLYMALDGETQGNDYQNALADIRLSFAVETGASLPARSPLADPPDGESGEAEPETPSGDAARAAVTDVVKTGDDMDLFPYYLAMSGSGALFLLLGADSLRRRVKRKGAPKR